MVVDVRLQNVRKRFGKTIAVDGVNLEIRKGELFGIIGPSGCGKTTTLRLIAGLEYPDEGKIYFGDKDVTYAKPYERNAAMVFQNYALWPHMTVFENVAYGLKIRKVPEAEIRRKVKEVLELTKLNGLESRYPTQLSGGQQQRVALARALVVEPEVLLLDEPLSNLDAKLRIEMRSELRNIIKSTGITAIYVTHDQEEAMSICDRIGIMNSGRLIQIGEPKELYFNPATFFVANFMGKSNVMEGSVASVNPTLIKINDIALKVDKKLAEMYLGKTVYVVVRPEKVKVLKDREKVNLAENVFEGRVIGRSFIGSHYILYVSIGDVTLTAYEEADEELRNEDRVLLFIDPRSVLIFEYRD